MRVSGHVTPVTPFFLIHTVFFKNFTYDAEILAAHVKFAIILLYICYLGVTGVTRALKALILAGFRVTPFVTPFYFYKKGVTLFRVFTTCFLLKR